MSQAIDPLAATRKLEHIDIEITHKCNLRCTHCSARAGGGADDNELSVVEIKELLRKATENGLRKVGLTGGEPLCALSKLEEITEYCRTALGISLHTHSNGTKIADMGREFSLLSAFDALSISFLAPDEKGHDLLVGSVGAFRSTLGGVSRLVSEKLPLTCYFIPFRGYCRGFGDLARRLSDEGVTRIRMMALAPSGRARSGFEHLVPSMGELGSLEIEMLEAASDCGIIVEAGYCSRLSFPRIGVLKGHEICKSAQNRVHINSKGDVFPCTAASGVPELTLGNVRVANANLGKIWEESETARRIRLMRTGKSEVCRDCGILPNCTIGCMVNTCGTMSEDSRKSCPIMNKLLPI